VFQEERGRLVLNEQLRAIYALQGSLRELPIEASLEEERRGPNVNVRTSDERTTFSMQMRSFDTSV